MNNLAIATVRSFSPVSALFSSPCLAFPLLPSSRYHRFSFFGLFVQLTTPTVSLARTEFAIFSVQGMCRIHRICIGTRYEIYLVWCSKYTRLILDAESLGWLRAAMASLSNHSSNRPYRVLIAILHRRCSWVRWNKKIILFICFLCMTNILIRKFRVALVIYSKLDKQCLEEKKIRFYSCYSFNLKLYSWLITKWSLIHTFFLNEEM